MSYLSLVTCILAILGPVAPAVGEPEAAPSEPPAASTPAAASTPDPGASPAAPVAGQRLDIFYTGFTDGLTSARVDFNDLAPFYHPAVQRDFEVGGFLPDNVFRHGEFILFTDAGPLTLEDFQAFFSTGGIQVGAAGTSPLLHTDSTYIFESGQREVTAPWVAEWLLGGLRKLGGFPDARLAMATRFVLTNRSGLTLQALSLRGEPLPGWLLETPTRWEMLPAGSLMVEREGRRKPVLAVGRLLGDGLRRSKLLFGLRAQVAASALTLDVGNLLDPGFSELSRQQREFTLLQLKSLGYDAVVPAETELSLEPADWDRLQSLVPLLAANLKPRDPARPGLPGHMIKRVNGLKVALIGVVDDKELLRQGEVGPRSVWTASDPVAAARAAYEALAPEQPDAVLILTNVRDDRLQALRHIQGVTAVLADFQGLPGDTYTESVSVTGQRRLRSQSALLVPHASPNRVGHLRIDYQTTPAEYGTDGADRSTTPRTGPPGGPDDPTPPALPLNRPMPERLTNTAHLVTDNLPGDEGWRWQLNVTQDRYQRQRRALLLPDLREALALLPASPLAASGSSLPVLDSAIWSRVVANLVRRVTASEVVITRRLPMRFRTIGPVSQLTLEGWLEVSDRLIHTTLSGKALKALAASEQASRLLAFSGYDPATQKIQGFALNDDELYRVTTTDMVARHALYESAFTNRPLEEHWATQADGGVRPQAAGERLALRDVVLGGLKRLKATHGDAFSAGYIRAYADLLGQTGERVEPRWIVQMDDGQLMLNGYRNQGNEPYTQVRNTRVTTPNSFSLGGKGRIQGIYDAENVAWENRAKAIYRRATITKGDQEVTQETDDEIVLTSELRLKFLTFPGLTDTLSPTPFVNTNYTTEFNRDEANGVAKPHRRELNAIAGLVLYPGLGFKEVRAGAVLKDDLANPGFLEPGVQVQAIFERKLEALIPATLKAGLDAVHYVATPTDTADRLGWQINLTSGLTIPLWERFSLTLSAEYLLYRGKVPETFTWGSSLDYKVGLGYSLAFKPFYGVWF